MLTMPCKKVHKQKNIQIAQVNEKKALRSLSLLKPHNATLKLGKPTKHRGYYIYWVDVSK